MGIIEYRFHIPYSCFKKKGQRVCGGGERKGILRHGFREITDPLR
jgi:hypothetical protein